MLGNATTALMGRLNYEGFYGYWPPVARDEAADERDRAIARWLEEVEKVVFSTTMTDAPCARLFEDVVPSSSWTLSPSTMADDGTVLLTYDRSQ